jgi:hypothetical protein
VESEVAALSGGTTEVADSRVLWAGSGGSPGSSAEASAGAGTGSGAGASTDDGASSVISDGAEAESVMFGAGVVGGVGDVGSVGSAGKSMMGDANRGSSFAGGNTGVVATNGIMWAHGDKGGRDGDMADGSIAGLENGERRISPSSSGPRNSSASLRRLLALLAGGVFTSGGEGGGGIVGDGGALFSGVASLQVEAATSSEGCGRQSRLPLAAVEEGRAVCGGGGDQL